ncbi:SAM-dependent methyltransferase [Streptomyces sp. WMMC500]|uniref:SAM-dependent methyltransferase n=1 Tax=Streptomyces sp. WMMC500 TaxID=3015154 RepID=UPI00248C9203|nr:SAM-dependent methyltransferase [Streptomyces sp. WMMC500]WBB60592.1 SAM-dependent methyltransferase [Streptomyces sp. WMMC500]
MGDTDGGGRAPLIDTTVPQSARIWNFWLGGSDNYRVDRLAGEAYVRLSPAIVDIARASRAFLTRSLRYLAAEAGIRQFLDVGTGLPTAQNTHEVAQAVHPSARVVYVDNDPMVLAHARALLVPRPDGACDYVNADLHDPGAVLDGAAKTLDFDEPVGLILSGIVGHVSDYDEARRIVARLVGALPAGSHLVLSDGTGVVNPQTRRAQDAYNRSGAVPYVLRTPQEIEGFFAGLELVEPGVVSCPRWRPEGGGTPELVDQFGGVGRKAGGA